MIFEFELKKYMWKNVRLYEVGFCVWVFLKTAGEEEARSEKQNIVHYYREMLFSDVINWFFFLIIYNQNEYFKSIWKNKMIYDILK